MAARQQNETTPLLWPQAPNFPGAGSFPAQGTFPSQGNQNSYYSSSQQFGGPQRFQFGNRLNNQFRPGTPQQSSKKIQHDGDLGKDPHSQFCALTGCPPTNAPPDFRYRPNEKTLYGRAVHMAYSQNFTYQFTAALTNTLLLAQIVLGAALTGLPATNIRPWVITLFGAANTIIAGLVAYLKSRGQPMRARMFRDDLERIVDEIENSEVMWLGISKNVHGYDDIDTDETVTVRSEVARLTRLLDKAIRTNSANVPELYSSPGGGGDSGGGNSGMRQSPMMNFSALGAVPIEGAEGQGSGGAAAAPKFVNVDESPATSSKKKETEKKDEKKDESSKAGESSSNTTKTEDKGKGTTTTTTSSSNSKQTTSAAAAAAPSAPPNDPDASPATAVRTKSNTSAPKKTSSESQETSGYKLDDP